MAIQTRTMYIEKRRKGDGTNRHRILPFFLVQDSTVGAGFEIMPEGFPLQRDGGLSGDVQNLDVESSKVTHVEFVRDEDQFWGGLGGLHQYKPYPVDFGDSPPAGVVLSP